MIVFRSLINVFKLAHMCTVTVTEALSQHAVGIHSNVTHLQLPRPVAIATLRRMRFSHYFSISQLISSLDDVTDLYSNFLRRHFAAIYVF